MFAVEALSSYISRGVNTVSSPFHPFGGAVDIVVVEQQDGSYKSSPWYVRFGKFQGVLKAKEKVVNISVDGVEADFHMYLDHAGVAYFLREVDADEMTSMLWHSSSDLQTDDRVSLKSKSCNYDAGQSSSVTNTDVSTGKFVSRTRSDGSQILGIVFESQSMKEVKYSVSEDKDKATSSLEDEEKKDLEIKGSIVNDADGSRLEKIGISSEFEKQGKSAEITRVEILCSTSETSPLCNSSADELNSEISRKIAEIDGKKVDPNEIIKGANFVASEASRIGNCEVFVKTTTQQISEVNIRPETEAKESLRDENCCNSFSNSKILESEDSSSNMKSVVTETYSEKITLHPVNGSAKEVDSCSITTISASKSIREAQDDLKADDSQEAEEINISRPNSPEEEDEQFLFSDLDEFKPREVKLSESISIDHQEQENPHSLLSSGVESANESFGSDSPQNDDKESRQVGRSISSHIDIPKSSKVSSQEVGCMVESLPTVLSDFDDLDAQDVQSLLTHSLDSNSKPSKWLLIRKDVAKCIKSARDEERCSSSKSKSNTEDDKISEELGNVDARPTVGDPSKISTESSGSWRLWPFSLSRSKKITELPPEKVVEPDPNKDTEPDLSKVTEQDPNKITEPDPSKVTEPGPTCTTDSSVENSLESNGGTEPEKKDLPKEKFRKHTVRANSPTSEELLSLNLKEGRNTITFTFLTSMLGEQKVDARIYLWRWDARIVISDVDGTITKSDILGQFMPLVGKDWSHTGVAHLFSAIKENGYQMLFLSARAISQAHLTRQFLFNLKQDGVPLPDGPVVISPDGLFPSLFREVIRRAPHEFKIACLEDIKALFPSDRNPFYAGFGNRDTDEISYVKVGIPKGKIFIVNPKGEVVVNRSVDTKSYTSLKTLVSRMFPPPSSVEPEDFNNWNFWKLPPPAIKM